MEARPAPVVHRLLEADARIEEQLPRRAGHDERQRQRIEIDRAQDALAADLLVEQDRERQAEDQAERDIEAAEHAHIDERGVPARRRVGFEGPGPQFLVIGRADQLGAGERLGVGERQKERPQVEAVDEDQHEQRRTAPARAAAASPAGARAASAERRRCVGDRRSRAAVHAVAFAACGRGSARRRVVEANRPPRAPRREARCRVYLAALIALTSSRDGGVGGLDLAVEELGHDVMIGAGDRRRLRVVLRHRTDEGALGVGRLDVGDALLAAHVEGGVRNVHARRHGALDDVERRLEARAHRRVGERQLRRLAIGRRRGTWRTCRCCRSPNRRCRGSGSRGSPCRLPCWRP